MWYALGFAHRTSLKIRWGVVIEVDAIAGVVTIQKKRKIHLLIILANNKHQRVFENVFFFVCFESALCSV